jgi:hypothetical protein
MSGTLDLASAHFVVVHESYRLPMSLVAHNAQILLRFLVWYRLLETYKIPTAIKDYFPTISKINLQQHRQQLCSKSNLDLKQAFAGKKIGATKFSIMYR